MIHILIPSCSSKEVEMFTSAEAFRYIMFVCKTFLANSFKKPVKLSTYNVDIIITNIVAYIYATVRYSKTCITHECNLRIDRKLGNKLILSKSTYVCHKSNMLGLQNGPSRKHTIIVFDLCFFEATVKIKTNKLTYFLPS